MRPYLEAMAKAIHESQYGKDTWTSPSGGWAYDAAIAALNALDGDHPNLGFPLFGGYWGVTVKLGEKEVVPIAFSGEQAKEIARRINEYYA